MENVKLIKGMMGYKEVTDNDEFTHVRIDKEQYEAYENAVKNAQEYYKYALYYKDLYEKQQGENQTLNDKMSKEKNRLWDDIIAKGNEIEKLETQVVELQEQADLQENRNYNLIRIAKERANADRGLQPKKDRSGYFLQNMVTTDRKYLYHLGGKQYAYYPKRCWKIQMQTPYAAGLNFKTIRELVRDDLSILMTELNLVNWYTTTYLEQMPGTERDKLWEQEENFMFGEDYRLNNDKGYWEITFYTRYSLPPLKDIIEKTDRKKENKKTRG